MVSTRQPTIPPLSFPILYMIDTVAYGHSARQRQHVYIYAYACYAHSTVKASFMSASLRNVEGNDVILQMISSVIDGEALSEQGKQSLHAVAAAIVSLTFHLGTLYPSLLDHYPAKPSLCLR